MTITLSIQGMSCQHCVHRVKKAIDAVAGVSGSQVTVGSAIVDFEPSQVSADALKKAVEEAGYTVTAP